ncbi:hypothetical protein HMPREF9123_2408 [Neisseria bacilliformis ATCC BAA-1200]|uniref:Uncharacterized protein n=1 Tax=Neisseria bacilliformis ATCC BAA-1200 TaxID=888742 RepID=F2BFA1_9NEIS|nr:hypothetical protein HMPREF9123_2408 [Neisseria bacilliformis ATCC BAA-1200]
MDMFSDGLNQAAGRLKTARRANPAGCQSQSSDARAQYRI